MNTLAPIVIQSPATIEETCAKFIIDEVLSPFVLHGITTAEEQYTLGLWIKSDSEGSVLIRGKTIPTTTEWVRHTLTYTANDTDLKIFFNTVDTYYIYHPKLEAGSKATDYTAAPEDIEDAIKDAQATADNALEEAGGAKSSLQLLADSLSTLVTDGNGTSLMTQTENGWTFSTSDIQNAINGVSERLNDMVGEYGDIDAVISVLQQNLTDLGAKTDFINLGSYTYTNENGEDETLPCIELGESDSEYKVLITNKQILFQVGSARPTRINTDGIVTENITIEYELRQKNAAVPGYYFWSVRANGNYGLQWKGDDA